MNQSGYLITHKKAETHNCMDNDKFIFCLEGVPDVDTIVTTDVVKNLEEIAIDQGIASIYKTCDTIEGLEESLNVLLYEQKNLRPNQ